ncbi:MAG: hypothetical protein WCI78_00890, partial [Mycobacterium sp.]
MRSELPAGRLRRRLGAGLGGDPHGDSRPDDAARDEADDESSDEDRDALLPRWLPDTLDGQGWVARVRADPGRAGAIAMAIVAALAVLVTVFTVLRDRPAPVMSAKLPPVEKVGDRAG